MKSYASATELWMRFAAGIVLTWGIGWLAGCGGGSSNNSSEQTAAAATPTYSVAAGTYTSAQTVALSDATAGATIYYTTNGTTPTTSSTAYTGPITVGSSETVEAIAVAGGFSTSGVATAAYVINLPAATPVFSVTPGTYTLTQIVTISSTTSGATIYYTTNGATPTTASTAYTGPISVASSETVEAIAVASGFSSSGVASAAYVINALPAISGVVSSAAPISGAHVYLFAANTTGYGQASVSLLGAAQTGHSDSVGAYVLSGTDGSFTLAGDYNCTAGTQLYLYALGGSAGNGANSAIGLMAAIGSCPAASSAAMTARVNEVSTIAAAYAMAGFATDATHVSSSGTALAQVGIANAFANAGNLATLSTGVALATTPAGNGTVPQSEINTLANILASCVDTLSGCSAPLSLATSDGTTAGVVPTDIATAAINIAHHPGANVALLFSGASVQTYAPVLTYQPGDFSILLTFTGGGQSGAGVVAIDRAGDVWVSNDASISEFSNLGAALSPLQGFLVGVPYLGFLGGGVNIAVDPVGNVWLTTATGVCEFSSAGSLLSPGCDSSGNTTADINTVAIDGQGNVWVDHNALGTVVEFNNLGTVISPSGGYTVGSATGLPYGTTANGLAIDGSGDVRVVSGSQLVTLSNSGTLVSSVALCCTAADTPMAIDSSGNTWISTGGAMNKVPTSGPATLYYAGQVGSGTVAVDGTGNVWTASNTQYGSSVVEFSNSGAVLSPYLTVFSIKENGFAYGILTASTGTSIGGLGIDGSGDVWVSASTKKLGELIGIASPVVTPISVGVKNNTLGTRP
jgi:hypothetical protein